MSNQAANSWVTDDLERVINGDLVLNALTATVIAVDETGIIRCINAAGEQLLRTSVGNLVGEPLETLLPGDSPLFSLICQARSQQQAPGSCCLPR